MFDDFLKFLKSLRKEKKTGITATDQAEKKLQEAADQFTKKTEPNEVTGGFDETTKSGEFKKGPKIIDEEGNVEAEVFSYRPESFTDTQRKNRVGEFTDDALREQFFDNKLDDTMSFSEFEDLRLNQGQSLNDVLERQRILQRIATDDPAELGFATPVSKLTGNEHPFIRGLASSANRNIEDVKQLIVDKMNEAYPPGDPKRVTMQDDDMIGAYIETQNMMNKEEFVEELFEAANDLTLKSTGNPLLDAQLAQEQKLIQQGAGVNQQLKTIRASAEEVKFMLDEMGLDTGDIDFDLIKNSDDLNAVKEEAMKIEKLMSGMMGGGMRDLVTTGNLGKAMDSITEQAKADMRRGQELLEKARTPGEGQEIIEKMEEVQKAFQEGMQTGVYKSPFATDRTLNSTGGRVGFANGNFSGTLSGDSEDQTYTLQGGKDFNGLSLSGNLQGNFDSSDSQTYNLTARKQIGPFGITGTYDSVYDDIFYDYDAQLQLLDNLELMLGYGSDDSISGQLRYSFDKGGRVGFNEGSGGPKMGRRGFLGLLGAGIGSMFIPRGAKEIAEVVAKGAAKTPLTAEGMPVWFPSLVNKIRKEGKFKKADYGDVKGGEGVDMYTYKDPNLPNKQIFMEEDVQTGAITISGRGDDMQLAELRFIPGEENIRLTEQGKKVSKDPNSFEAEEFMKGPGEGIGDYENFGSYDDMQFGVESWANLVKSPAKKLQEAADEFTKKQTNPTPQVSGKTPEGEEFAKGGRVGYNVGGGVQTLFRRKAS